MSKPTHNQAIKKLIESQQEQIDDLRKQLDKAFDSQKPALLKKIEEKEKKIMSLGGKVVKKLSQAPGFNSKMHHLKFNKPYEADGGRRTRRSRSRKTRRKARY